jgi:hypothetical protein
MTTPTPLPIQPPAPIPAVPVPLPVPPPIPGAPIAPMPIADVELVDIVEALTDMLKARDAAIAGLTALIAEMRGDHAVLAARVDALDPPDATSLPGFVTLKEASFASGFTVECIRQWAKAGMGIKRGGVWQVELASVLERAGRKPG